MKRNVELSAQNTKILVCCHKSCTLPPDEEGLLLPIHCGAALSDVDLKMQRDDQVLGQPCDNISLKNGIYNELTGTYWAWKNIKKLYPDLEYIGLCHYRRYFNFAKKGPFFHRSEWYISESKVKTLDCGLGALKKLMQSCDVILPVSVYMPFSHSSARGMFRSSTEGRIIEAVILKLHPDYKDTLLRYNYKSNEQIFKNMFVMRWELFEQYAKWLFDILSEVEKLVKFAPYVNEKQTRMFGYTGEHLLPLFCIHNRLSITSRQLWFVSEGKNSSLPKLLCSNCFNNLRFVLNMLGVNVFPRHGVIQMISQGESVKAMFKRVGVWEAIEQLKPVAPSPTH